MAPVIWLILANTFARVVVIGDMHGDIDNTRSILRSAGLLDSSSDEWVGGTAHLVCTGDMVDRGPDGHGIIDLLINLQRSAGDRGGRVDVLLGNHEVMNVKGDWAFVDPRDTASHGGIPARQAAFSAEGRYGRFIRSLPLVLIIGDIILCHGGLLYQWARYGSEEINRMGRESMQKGVFDAPILMNDGPVWSREVIMSALRGECTPLKNALRALSIVEGKEIRRMVIGHTAQLHGKMSFLCDNQLAAIDVYASSFYEGGGWSTYLEIDGDAFAWHQVGPQRVQRPVTAVALSQPSKAAFVPYTARKAGRKVPTVGRLKVLLISGGILCIALGWYNVVYVRGRKRYFR